MLKLENVVAKYGAITALRGISIEVNQGELVALIGVNGAGKSTTLNTIAGNLRPTQGSVTFEGESIAGKTPEQIARRGIMLVPEGRDIFPSLSTEENLRLGAFTRSRKPLTPTLSGRKEHDSGERGSSPLSPRERETASSPLSPRERVGVRGDYAGDLEEIFTLFPILKDRRNQAGGTLSGGEQQQLAIARALMAHPRLLMLDEPSLGLSPVLVDQIFELVKTLHQRGTTILLVEQNVDRTLDIVDRAYLLNTGRIEMAGTPDQLRKKVDIESVYLGDQ